MKSEKPLLSDTRPMLSTEEMIAMKNSISDFVVYILGELREKVDNRKDFLFMYSLSRAVVQVDAIASLYQKKYYSDCRILYRTQIERLLTLHYLIDSNTIEDFDDWSFIQVFEERNKVKSDITRNQLLNKKFWEEGKERVEKYKLLKKNRVTWERPNSSKLEEISKQHGVHVLYKYGYKSASGEVHPIASDGFEEFGLILGLKPQGYPEYDNRPILNNALSVFIEIVIFILNEIDFEWFEPVSMFLESCKKSLRSGTTEYEVNKKIIDMAVAKKFPIYRKYDSESTSIL
jgi:hypothetical protein